MENSKAYNYLMECAEKKDAKAWNSFMRKNRKMTILLEGVNISNQHFKNFSFKGIVFDRSNIQSTVFEKCDLNGCHFKNMRAYDVVFQNSQLTSSFFNDASFSICTFTACDLRFCDFTRATIHQTDLTDCKMNNSIFLRSSFKRSIFKNCIATNSNFRNCEILETDLSGSTFLSSIVDGGTIVWSCSYDELTNFTGVGLSNMRIEPSLKSSFSCNIRRLWWQKWYEEKKLELLPKDYTFKDKPLSYIRSKLMYFLRLFIHLIIKAFWWITDYGSSTIRLLIMFFLTTLGYAIIYFAFPASTGDVILNGGGSIILRFVRSLYFSTVVMTSVGFGDISASETLILGHVIMMIQSLLGYVLLGAFLVRIGILFQGEFPVSKRRYFTGDYKN
jgi:uncharacterized protein YjbI with pentapeptide repeats